MRWESYVPCNSPVGRLGCLDEHLGLKQQPGCRAALTSVWQVLEAPNLESTDAEAPEAGGGRRGLSLRRYSFPSCA